MKVACFRRRLSVDLIAVAGLTVSLLLARYNLAWLLKE